LESDGGVALLVTTAERAAEHGAEAVSIVASSAMQLEGGHEMFAYYHEDRAEYPEGRVLALEKALVACGERLSKAETRHGKWIARVRERTGIQKEFTFDSETGVISEISSE
jgi:hypothetical protein